MMIHRIPAEFEGEEKIFGGHFTLKQAVYFAAGIILAGVVFTLPLPLSLRIVLAGLFVFLAAALAVVKIYEMPGDVFLITLVSYLRREKAVIFTTEERK